MTLLPLDLRCPPSALSAATSSGREPTVPCAAPDEFQTGQLMLRVPKVLPRSTHQSAQPLLPAWGVPAQRVQQPWVCRLGPFELFAFYSWGSSLLPPFIPLFS